MDDFELTPEEELYENWAAAGGFAANPGVKKHLYEEAKRLGVRLPGMPAPKGKR
jgi:hypothetical protein